ncbi:hypothetical protein EV05_1038 [Prochlorococcus sp. MIT 0601]|nr:hypothetical protein EV05_1038 [Prochlorococcus sp. MIT 0601]
MLDGVDQMLQECKGLLNTSTSEDKDGEFWLEEESEGHGIAA